MLLLNKGSQKAYKMKDAHKGFINIPFGLTLVVQREDRDPWMHSTAVKHGSKDHKNRSYKMPIMKVRHNIAITTCHIKQTPILIVQYLHDYRTKAKIGYWQIMPSTG